MKLKKIIASILVVYTVISCNVLNNNENNSVIIENQKLTYTEIAKQKYGSETQFLKNSTNNFILCFKREKKTAANPNPILRFFIFSEKEQKIIYEANEIGGEVKWLNDKQVEITFVPGIVKSNEKPPFHYIYDVEQKKRID